MLSSITQRRSNRIAEIGLFLVLLIGILGIVPSKSLSIRTSKEIILEWSAIAFIAVVLIENVWWKMFLLWTLTGTIMAYNRHPEISKAAFFFLYSVFLYSIFYTTIVLRVVNINKVLTGICIIAVINSTFLILQYLGFWYFVTPLNGNKVCLGFLDNTNLAGAFTALCIPAFMRKGYWIGLILVIPSLFLSVSFGAVISAVTGIVVWSVFMFRKKAIFTIIAIIVMAIVYFNYFENNKDISNLHNRFPVWKFCAEKIIPVKPWVGFGPGQFHLLVKAICKDRETIQIARNIYVHNEYIQSVVEQGFVGLVIIIGYLISLLVRYIQNINKTTSLLFAGIIIGAVNCAGNFLMHITVGILLVTYLALFEIETRRSKDVTNILAS